MSSLYECVQEIKHTTGWSQERISAETGLAISTVSRIFRVPCYSGNETSRRLVVDLYKQVVSSPFPKQIEKAFNHYDLCKERFSARDFAEYSEVIESLLLQHKSIDSQELISCRICWFLGHIYFDRAFYLKQKNTIALVQCALNWYQKALSILDVHSGHHLKIQKYKLQQCIVATNFNCCEAGKRSHDLNIIKWLNDLNYIMTVKEVIRVDEWNWIAARNGLVAAAILHNFDDCIFFFEAMKKVNRKFADVDFQPSKDFPALKDDVDLVWFVEQLGEKL